jgi:hypothetical protein
MDTLETTILAESRDSFKLATGSAVRALAVASWQRMNGTSRRQSCHIVKDECLYVRFSI